MSKIVIAIFVKTPGGTPLKTRLSKTIGKEFAESFYRKSVRATKEIVDNFALNVRGVSCYWAVAEKECANEKYWKNYPTLFQGNGDLGERLNHIYNNLIERHDEVIIIGSDSPLLSPSHLQLANFKLNEYDFVVGPARDGGFYLFAGKKKIDIKVWRSVEYSQSKTLAELKKGLEGKGSLYELPVLSDVDTEHDLKYLVEESIKIEYLYPEQIDLIDWVKSNLS